MVASGEVSGVVFHSTVLLKRGVRDGEICPR